MKTYTDLNQSEKLAEILPLESADMHYWKRTWKENDYAISVGHSKEWQEGFESMCIEYIPAWSLAALLEIIRKPTAFDLLINGRGYRCHCRDKQEGKFYGTDDYCDTPVDACYEIILKLHEQNLL